MKTLKITSKDVKDTNYYWKEYIGKTDVSDYDGNIEIEENLGYVRFSGNVKAKGYILAKAGSGIKAGWGIEAGSGIEAGWGIEAGDGIEAGWFVKCKLKLNIGLRIFAGLCLWREPTEDEMKIECGKLVKGKVCYGNLIETGLPKKKSKPKEIVKEIIIDGVTFVPKVKNL